MAVVLKNQKAMSPTEIHLELYCDNFSELSDLSAFLPDGSSVQAGSVAYKADGTLAIYNGSSWITVQ